MGIFGNALSGWHLLVIVLVVLVLFGATKLPVFAKGLGQSIKIFKKEIDDVRDDSRPARATNSADEPERETVTTPDTQTHRASDGR